jgi:hypothetical protein
VKIFLVVWVGVARNTQVKIFLVVWVGVARIQHVHAAWVCQEGGCGFGLGG